MSAGSKTRKASTTITILTEDAVPTSIVRSIRKSLTGSVLSRSEKLDGLRVARLQQEEASLWHGTAREAAGDDQILSLPNSVVATHFSVLVALGKRK